MSEDPNAFKPYGRDGREMMRIFEKMRISSKRVIMETEDIKYVGGRQKWRLKDDLVSRDIRDLERRGILETSDMKSLPKVKLTALGFSYRATGAYLRSVGEW